MQRGNHVLYLLRPKEKNNNTETKTCSIHVQCMLSNTAVQVNSVYVFKKNFERFVNCTIAYDMTLLVEVLSVNNKNVEAITSLRKLAHAIYRDFFSFKI